MQLKELIVSYIQSLQPYSATPRLDVELLTMAVLGLNRTQLYTHSDAFISKADRIKLHALFERRIVGESVAYILGEKEFWSLPLKVSEATLVPRPDTELLVELALSMLPADQPIRLVDLGTGSGAIAVALAHERPQWEVYGIDVSMAAAKIASQNANKFAKENCQIIVGHWLDAIAEKKCHTIVTNPPYLASNDPHLKNQDISQEPINALVAGKTGLEQIEVIIQQAKHCLLPNGWLLIEHGYEQGDAVVALLQQAGYVEINTHTDLAGLPRVSVGRS